jgi:hypothetical protein
VADEDAARTLLIKLREFALGLDPNERELFAVLVGPGVAQALGTSEVEAYSFVSQERDRLARGLVEIYRRDEASNDSGLLS